MKTMHIIGAGMTDDIYTTDPAIFGSEISWNVSRLRKAAEDGMFGEPESIPMSVLPPLSPQAAANIDWLKVYDMARLYAAGGLMSGPLSEPAINVSVSLGSGAIYRIPVDGNHRMMVWRLRRQDFWAAYIVPPEMEQQFRVGMF